MESSFQLMIAYDMFYYVKFTALSIKTMAMSYFSGAYSPTLYYFTGFFLV